MGGHPKYDIRPLERADRENWRSLWTAYLEFYESQVSDEVYDVYFDRLLGDDVRDYHGLIAYKGDEAVGLTHYLFHRHGWRVEDVCYLQDLYATPSSRGTGLGRKLIEAVFRKADEHGAGNVWWLTQEHNYTARQLYDRIAKKTPFIQYSSPRN